MPQHALTDGDGRGAVGRRRSLFIHTLTVSTTTDMRIRYSAEEPHSPFILSMNRSSRTVDAAVTVCDGGWCQR